MMLVLQCAISTLCFFVTLRFGHITALSSLTCYPHYRLSEKELISPLAGLGHDTQ